MVDIVFDDYTDLHTFKKATMYSKINGDEFPDII